MHDDLDIFTSPGEIFSDFIRAVDAGNKIGAMQFFEKVSRKAVDEAACYVFHKNFHPSWVEDMTALRPSENYVGLVNQMCSQHHEASDFNAACQIFLSTHTPLLQTSLLLKEDAFFSLTESNQNSLIQRLKLQSADMLLNTVVRSNLKLIEPLWDTIQKSSDCDAAIRTIVGCREFGSLMDHLMDKNCTHIVWGMIYSYPALWIDFLQAALECERFSLAQNLLDFADGQSVHYTDRLNTILCWHVSRQNIQPVKMLLKYYDCFYENGIIIQTASMQRNADIFDLLYDATPLEVCSEVLANMTNHTPQHRQLLDDHLNSQRLRHILHDMVDSPTHNTKRKI